MTDTIVVDGALVDGATGTPAPAEDARKPKRKRAPRLETLPAPKAFRPGTFMHRALAGDTTLGYLRGVCRAAGAKCADDSLVIFTTDRTEVHPA